MKLEIKNFDELSAAQKKETIDQMGECYNVDYLTNEDYTRSVVDAEVAIGEDGCIYDVRVYDPYGHIKSNGHMPVYINADGWSHWLFDYRDNAGNDVDTIMEDMEEACSRFIGALVTYNGDPFLVEDDETALDVIKAIDRTNTVVELTPDDDGFTDACERLDLDPEAYDVKRVLSYPGMLICMPEDWAIA